MGIVVKQSIQNSFFTYIGFIVGALNTLYLYTYILGDDFYGLTAFILSTANILMPILSFGIQTTLIKFYPTFSSTQDQSRFLNLALILPIIIIVLFGLIFWTNYNWFSSIISARNPIIKSYVWIIPLIGISMAYFEIFYAWLKVHYRSVLGNFIKELGLRLAVSVSLLSVHFYWIDKEQFLYSLVVIYASMTLWVAYAAFKIRPPEFRLGILKNRRSIIAYSAFIILSSGIAIVLLDIDKFMLGLSLDINETAYYSVSVFMALTISVPMRAMHQITHPITTQLMAKGEWLELNQLYKKSSITLQTIGGLIFVGIVCNLESIYALLPVGYSQGMSVVIIIGLSKMFDLLLGNNNSIVFNSDYYRTVLFIGLGLIIVTIGLNYYMIPIWGIKGAAMATMISIGLYSISKLLFVVFKLKLFPFTKSTIHSLIIFLSSLGLFYPLSFQLSPIISIILKSILIGLYYLGLHYYFNVSKDLNFLIQNIVNKVVRFFKFM